MEEGEKKKRKDGDIRRQINNKSRLISGNYTTLGFEEVQCTFKIE